MSVATDAADHAYFASENPDYLMLQLDVVSGSITWAKPDEPAWKKFFGQPGTALLSDTAEIELVREQDPFGTDASALISFAMETGKPAIREIANVNDLPPDLLVGDDGSLLCFSSPKPGVVAVVRIGRDRRVEWVSAELATFSASDGTVQGSNLALEPGPSGSVIVALYAYSERTFHTIVVALDAGTGKMRWKQSVPGELSAAVIGRDGSIAFGVGGADGGGVIVLERSGELRFRSEVPQAAIPIAAALDGSVVFLSWHDDGTGVAAVDASGEIAWERRGHFTGGTIASNGTLVMVARAGDEIEGLDLATGATQWTLPTPSARRCESGGTTVALTSTRGIVGAACDGTLFGAHD